MGENAGELGLRVEKLGVSEMDAIVSATKVGAEALGLEKELGTIEKGKLADIIIVDGNPSTNIKILQDLEKIKMVMLGGEIKVNRGL